MKKANRVAMIIGLSLLGIVLVFLSIILFSKTENPDNGNEVSSAMSDISNVTSNDEQPSGTEVVFATLCSSENSNYECVGYHGEYWSDVREFEKEYIENKLTATGTYVSADPAMTIYTSSGDGQQYVLSGTTVVALDDVGLIPEDKIYSLRNPQGVLYRVYRTAEEKAAQEASRDLAQAYLSGEQVPDAPCVIFNASVVEGLTFEFRESDNTYWVNVQKLFDEIHMPYTLENAKIDFSNVLGYFFIPTKNAILQGSYVPKNKNDDMWHYQSGIFSHMSLWEDDLYRIRYSSANEPLVEVCTLSRIAGWEASISVDGKILKLFSGLDDTSIETMYIPHRVIYTTEYNVESDSDVNDSSWKEASHDA